MQDGRCFWCVIAALVACGLPGAAQHGDRRERERIEQMLRQEGQAVIALADAAEAGQARTSDFAIDWHHDFFKAQAGTFVPFIVSVPGRELRVPAVLLYVRLTRRGAVRTRGEPPDGRAGDDRGPHAVEEIYPVEVSDATGPVRISRGVSAHPGDYDLTVVVRERERPASRGRRHGAVLQQRLRVPDFGERQLTTSTIMLANRLRPLSRALSPDLLLERPYAIGTHEVERRLDPVFGRAEELIVVFLVYYPAVTTDKHFDLEVEYHFFRTGARAAGRVDGPAGGDSPGAAQPGERYVNRTEPQRFTPLVLGPQFEPAAGQPLLAGQRVPLTDFAAGDYRLAITVTDLVAGRAIGRQVFFSVRP